MVCRPGARRRARDCRFPSLAQGAKPSRRVAVLMGLLTEQRLRLETFMMENR